MVLESGLQAACVMSNDTPIKVLLIEDNPGDARLIQETLKKVTGSPIVITQVSRLKDGLLELEKNNYDALLLDLTLPDSEASRTLAEIREHSPHIPTVLLTGMDNDDFGLSALQQGAQDYLTKDMLNGEMLTHSLRYAIERKRIEDARYKKEKKRVRNYEITDILEPMAEKIDDIHIVLHGNSEPEKGMIYRLLRVEDFMGVVKRIAWIAAGALIAGGIGYFVFG